MYAHFFVIKTYDLPAQANLSSSMNGSGNAGNAAAVNSSRVDSNRAQFDSHIDSPAAAHDRPLFESPSVTTPDNSVLSNVDNSRNSTSSLNGSASETNAVFAVLEALLGGTAGEKSAALIEALNLLKEDTMINEENSYDLLSAILSCTEDDDVSFPIN